VLLEPDAIRGRKGVVEVLGDELDELLAGEVGRVHAFMLTREGRNRYKKRNAGARTETYRCNVTSVPTRGSELGLERDVAAAEDARIVEALRAGDERAFVMLVQEHGATMIRVASLYVRNRAVAEEVVQETWLGVLKGIDRFEGRSTLKTWLFRILTNTATTRAVREGRTIPFSALAGAELGDDEPLVDADRFLPAGDRWANHWTSSPLRFDDLPDGRLLSSETVAVARTAIEELPEVQRAVITMRDVAGFSSEEVCGELDLSEGNQRVLLHRARTKVRAALERHFEAAEES